MNIKTIGGSNDVSDVFNLYDLRVKVVASDKPMVCDHQVGEYFDVIGEMIVFPEGGRNSFTLYPLAAILPLLPMRSSPAQTRIAAADSISPGSQHAVSAMLKQRSCRYPKILTKPMKVF